MNHWINDGLEALEIGRRLGRKVVVMATSTGGTLATWLLLGPLKAEVAATVLVSPNLTLVNRRSEILLWPGKELWLSIFIGNKVEFQAQNALQERFWDVTHHSHSLIPMMKLVSRARKLNFSHWPSPVLIVTDSQDTVVDAGVTTRLFAQAPRSVATIHPWNAQSGDDHHVLAGEALSPKGTDAFVALVVNYLKDALPQT